MYLPNYYGHYGTSQVCSLKNFKELSQYIVCCAAFFAFLHVSQFIVPLLGKYDLDAQM